MDAILGPAAELVDASRPACYPLMKYGDYRAAFHAKSCKIYSFIICTFHALILCIENTFDLYEDAKFV